MLRKPDFTLTVQETALLAEINFDALSLDGYEDAKRNGEAVCALMKSLVARKAILEARAKWFLDPDYFPGGRGKSRKQLFERNGCMGDDIYRHPHFLPYLWYFLYGAKLAAPAILEFRAAVECCGDVASSDVIPLGKTACAIARSHRLDAHEACEEFYKLALDCGVWHSYATHIRDAVRKMR